MTEMQYWTHDRVSRRGVLRGAGIVGAGLSAAALVGCSSSSKQETPAAQNAGASGGSGATVQRTGTLRIVGNKLAESFNPFTMISQGAEYWGLWGNLSIRANKQTSKLEPSLVESWEIKSPTEIAFKIRKGVLFHDKAPTNGREFNAEDLAYSINRHAGLLDPQKIALYPRRTNFRGMTKAEAVDASTVVLRMSKPNSAILNGLTDMRTPILAIETKDSDFIDPNLLTGTGPWVGKQLNKDGGGTYVANTKYWEPGLPKVAGIERTYIDTRPAIVAAFIGDTIDVLTMNTLPYSEVKSVAERRPDAKQMQWEYGFMHFCRFNCAKAPFNDERVRTAFRLVVDVKAMGDAYFGPIWDYSGPISPTWVQEGIPSAEIKKRPGWNPDTKEQDITEAKRLMAAAGFPEGLPSVTMLPHSTPANTANAERVRAQWNKVWPKTKLTFDGPHDSVPFLAKVAAGQFDLLTYALSSTSDGADEFATFFSTDGSKNYGKFSDPEVDKLNEQAVGEYDTTKRTKLVKDATEIVIAKSPMAPFFNPKQVAFLNPKWQGIEGFPGPAGFRDNDIIEGTKFVTLKA